MPSDSHVERLMAKLVRAVEVSLEATQAARDAVAEIRRPRLGARADRARPRLPPLTRHPTRSGLAVRGVLLLLVVIMAFVFIAPLLRGWRLRLSGADTERPDPLVKDPFCGTYVLRSRAIRRESGGEALHFCSAECAARFARGDRPVS